MNRLRVHCLASLMLLAPALAVADSQTPAGSTDLIGRIVGLGLFGYLLLKILNRRNSAEASEGTKKRLPWLVGIVLCLLLLWIVMPKRTEADVLAVMRHEAYQQCETQGRKGSWEKMPSPEQLSAYCRCFIDKTTAGKTVGELRRNSSPVIVDRAQIIGQQCRLQSAFGK